MLRTFALLADAPPPGPADGERLLLLRFADQPGVESEQLREQVAVYTRDLGLDVRLSPVDLPSAAIGAVAEAIVLVREQGARLAFWCEPADADGTVTLHLVDARGVAGRRVIKTTERDPAELYRAVALKLRAVLSGTAAVDAPPADPAVAKAPGGSAPARAPEAPVVARDRSPSPEVEARANAPEGAPASTSRFAVGLGYRFTAPSGLAPVSHAVDLSAAIVVARAGELALGTALSGRSSHDSSAGQISVLDVPLRLGVRAIARWDRLALGMGAFAGAHLLDASARASDGRQTDSSAWVGAGGLELLGRVRVWRGIAGELRAHAELPVPRTRFWVEGVPTFDFGPRVGLTLSLVFSAP
jgi:hypothetical protein